MHTLADRRHSGLAYDRNNTVIVTNVAETTWAWIALAEEAAHVFDEIIIIRHDGDLRERHTRKWTIC